MRNLSIAVDSGKHSTKGITKIGDKIEKVIFRTKVQEVTNLGVDISNNSYLVQYNGKSYLIGDMISEDKCDFNISKNSISHQISIYLAIAKLLEKMDVTGCGLVSINLALNIPLNFYKNNVLKSEYAKFMENNGQIISLKVNGTAFAFKIATLTLLPEATGPIYQRINEFKGKRVTIVDIGSLNVNYCMFNGLVPLLDTMLIANTGVNVLRGKIAEALTSKYGILVSDEDVEQILKDGHLYIGGIKQNESKEIIKKIIEEHVNEIFNYARSRGITFNNSSLFFCGGGAMLLKEYIRKVHPLSVIEENAQFTNTISYLRILEVKYGKE